MGGEGKKNYLNLLLAHMFCEEGTLWSSSAASPSDMPSRWCFVLDDKVKLKDMGSGFYKNGFEEGSTVTFRYELPTSSSSEKRLLLSQPSLKAEERKTVYLYRVAHGHDNFLGTWKVVFASEGEKRPYVLLCRLSSQPAASLSSAKKRSRSEEMHHAALLDIFKGLDVVFEPECASGLRTPCVVDGRINPWSSTFYTADFVLADVSSCRYVSVESKPSADALDEKAFMKCRRLRDVGHRRVVSIVGHGEDVRFYDFGTCASDEQWLRKEEVRGVLRV